jgi:hypothetical protein
MSARWATPAGGKTQVKAACAGMDIMSAKKSAFAGAVALALSACAASPEDIPPAYVSDATYADWTCEQLAKENMQLSAALANASQQQEDARTNDTVGVIFLGLPIGSMTGDNVAPEVARLKGHTNAVQQAMIRKDCGSTTTAGTTAAPAAIEPAAGTPTTTTE